MPHYCYNLGSSINFSSVYWDDANNKVVRMPAETRQVVHVYLTDSEGADGKTTLAPDFVELVTQTRAACGHWVYRHTTVFCSVCGERPRFDESR